MEFPIPVLDQNLSKEELAFFSRSPAPTLAEVEAQLVAWMIDPQIAMLSEISAAFNKGALYGVQSGKAAADRNDKAQVALPVMPQDTNVVVVTHNHPAHTPLSSGDVVVAVKNNLQEIRAAGKYGTFSLKRLGQKWPLGPEEAGALYVQLEQQCVKLFGDGDQSESLVVVCDGLKGNGTYSQLMNRVMPMNPPDPRNMGKTLKEDFFLSKHMVWKHLAAKYPGEIAYSAPAEGQFVIDRVNLYVVDVKAAVKKETEQGKAEKVVEVRKRSNT